MPSDRLSCIFCGRKESFKGLRGLHVHFNTCPAYRAIWERKQNPHSLLGSPKRALSPLPPEKRKRGRFDEQGGRDDDRGEGPNHPQQSGQSTDDLESPQLNQDKPPEGISRRPGKRSVRVPKRGGVRRALTRRKK